MSRYKNAILFYNTESGHSKKGRQLEIIKAHFKEQDIILRVVQFPKPEEDIQTTLDRVSSDDADLLIAAGGDGTVSLLSNRAINTEKTLGVIPLGTGNLLAQELKIPINLEKALNLITADNPKIFLMDTIMLNERSCLLNVSAGLSPKVMKSTQSKEKQRFGLFAYIVNFFQQFLGLKRHRFFIEYDNQNMSFVATEVLITNGGSAGIETLKLSDNVKLNDGQLDLFIIRAKNFYDVINLVFSLFSKKNHQSSVMKHIKFSDYCRIETQTSLPVQADGDTIGETPIEIKVLHESLRVIIGENYEEQKNK